MTVSIDFSQVSGWMAKLVLVVLALTFLCLAWLRLRRWWAARKYQGRDLASMRRRWAEIEGLAGQKGEMGRKMAIMEADKLLDSALKGLSMPGNTLGERLKFAAYKYPDLRKVWFAHRIRNKLAHESTFRLDASLAKKAIRNYRAALKMLGAI